MQSSLRKEKVVCNIVDNTPVNQQSTIPKLRVTINNIPRFTEYFRGAFAFPSRNIHNQLTQLRVLWLLLRQQTIVGRIARREIIDIHRRHETGHAPNSLRRHSLGTWPVSCL